MNLKMEKSGIFSPPHPFINADNCDIIKFKNPDYSSSGFGGLWCGFFSFIISKKFEV